MILKNESMKSTIVLKTNDNNRAKKILDFFKIDVSEVGARIIIIEYENLEQVASICRLMVEANIDIAEVFISQSD